VTFLVFHPLAIQPPLIAAMLGSALGSLGPRFHPSPFLLSRPLETGAVVRAKFQTAALSTLAGAGLVLVAGLCWLVLTGTAPAVAAWWREVRETYPPAQVWSMLLLGLVGLVGLTWLQLCKGIVVGLLGRAQALCIPVVEICLLLAVILSWQWLLIHPEHGAWFCALLPWLLGAAVLLKLLAGGWAVVRVRAAGLWPTRTVAAVLGTWLLTLGCLLELLAWLAPAERVPLHLLALGVVLIVPLARILAAPLALEWTRHR
jgi:hypothetical protein